MGMMIMQDSFSEIINTGMLVHNEIDSELAAQTS